MSLDDSLRRTANQAFFDRLYVQDDNWIEGQVGEPFNIVFDPEIQKLALRREAEGESGTQTSSVARLNNGHLVGSSISESKKKKWPMAIEAARAAEALRPEASQYSNRSLDPDSSLTHLSQRRVSTKQTQAMVEAYRAGESVGAIAKRLGFHRGTVAAHLKEAGLIVRADPRNPETCRRVVEVYQRVGSYKGTARELGICHKTVRKIVTRSENQ